MKITTNSWHFKFILLVTTRISTKDEKETNKKILLEIDNIVTYIAFFFLSIIIALFWICLSIFSIMIVFKYPILLISIVLVGIVIYFFDYDKFKKLIKIKIEVDNEDR